MQALSLRQGVYRLIDIPVPIPAHGEILIENAWAGVNRADLLQWRGRYPQPEGEYCVPGLEVSGKVAALGEGVENWRIGDNVCALVSEGAFAPYALASASLLLPVSGELRLEAAACLPEACFTAWSNLIMQAGMKTGDRVLIHGATSGVGSIAIQLAAWSGACVFATAGSPEKCEIARGLGAARAIDYHQEDFVSVITAETAGEGVDIILDMVGGDYFERHLKILARGGRLLVIAFQKGARTSANLGPLLLKNLVLSGSALRSRPLAEKTRIQEGIGQSWWREALEGRLRPLFDQVFALEAAEKALLRMEQGLNTGKILLKIR
jgi:putative PIG3 family NAD(P)H quinone oxidoreductase